MTKWFKNLSPIMQVIMVIIALFVVWQVWRLGKSFIQKSRQLAENAGEKAALEANGIKPTYTDNEYDTFAQKLYEAMDGIGTYDDDVFAVFEEMENDYDIIKLESAFGIREAATLDEWILSEMDDGEIDTINSYFSSKGIKKRY